MDKLKSVDALFLSTYSKLLDKLLAYWPRRSATDYSEIINNSSSCTLDLFIFLQWHPIIWSSPTTSLDINLIATNFTT